MDNVKLPEEVQQGFSALGVNIVQGAIAVIGTVIVMTIGIIGGLARGDGAGPGKAKVFLTTLKPWDNTKSTKM